MARYRISGPAKADIVGILSRSEQVHGRAARIRYRACLAAAMRRVAADPGGRSSVSRYDLASGLRSFHTRYSREDTEAPVANPVHVLFYRVVSPGLVEIVRVLHERMDPVRHIGSAHEP